MKSIFLPVLDETTVDGVEITKEWIEKYAPTMEGKPVNLDHNYYTPIPITVGTVDKVFFDTEGRLYAKITIQDGYYYKIMDTLEGFIDDITQLFKGVSFEFDKINKAFKGLALCFNSIPKVDFAKLNHQLMVDTILASVKTKMEKRERENMNNTDEIAKIVGEVIDKKVPELVKNQVEEILASKKLEDNTNEGNENDVNKDIEILASAMNENNTLLKTLVKNIEELRNENKELLASRPAGSPPNGSGGDAYYEHGREIDF